MLAGETGVRMSRKPDIMADAAYLILSQNSRDLTGQFLIDDDVLRQHGVTDMDHYANVPGQFSMCMYMLSCMLYMLSCMLHMYMYATYVHVCYICTCMCMCI